LRIFARSRLQAEVAADEAAGRNTFPEPRHVVIDFDQILDEKDTP